MSERIEVGDLVIVVGPLGCSCAESKIAARLGRIFEVLEIKNRLWRCKFCLTVYPLTDLAYSSDGCYETYRLKKLRAPPIAQDVETREELHA